MRNLRLIILLSILVVASAVWAADLAPLLFGVGGKDDVCDYQGADNDICIVWDSADARLEFRDSSGNVIFWFDLSNKQSGGASVIAPEMGLFDLDGAGADRADKYSGGVSSNMDTVTEDAEDSTTNVNYMDGGTKTAGLAVGGATPKVNAGSLPIVTTGTLQGRNKWGTDITGNTNHDTTELHGLLYFFTAAATVTLDAAADAGYGSCASYRIRDAAEEGKLDPQAGEKMNFAGTALAAGTAIAATGAGEYCSVCAATDTDGSGTDGYLVYGETSGWASE